MADYLRSRGVYDELQRVLRAYVAEAGGGGGGGEADAKGKKKQKKKKGSDDGLEGLLSSLGWPSSSVPSADVPLLARLQPGRLYLHMRIHAGKAFVGNLAPRHPHAAAVPGASATTVACVQFGAQRFSSAPVEATAEPRFDSSFVIDLGVPVRNPAGFAGASALTAALQLREPVQLLVLREDGTGEVEVVASQPLEWRRALVRGRVSLAVSLRAHDPEVTAPAGVLDVDLEVLPMRPPPPGRRRGTRGKEKKKKKSKDETSRPGDGGGGGDAENKNEANGSDDDSADDGDNSEDSVPELPVYVDADVLRQQFEREAAMDAAEEQQVRACTRAFWRDFQQIRPSHVHRLVKLYATTETGARALSCSFLAPLRAGRLIDSPLHAARFVSLLPWRRDCTIGGERTEVWHSLHTVLARGAGDVEDHAVLLCSLLLGFGLDAYVCVGTSPAGAHVWVATRKTADTAVFWEPLTGRRYDVGAILLQHVAGAGGGADAAAPPPESVLPFRAVHCMLNDRELFANCQLDDSVAACSWDLADPDAWKALRLADTGAPPPRRRALPRLAPCAFSAADEEAALERELRALVSFYRSEELGADTLFDDAFSYILGPALAAYEAERVTGREFGNEEFQQAVRGHLRPTETFRGLPFQFNHRSARRMLTRMLRAHRGACVALVRSRGDAVRFGLRVKVVPYAEDVCAVWVMIAVRGRLEEEE